MATVFLALDDAAVTGQKAAMLEDRPQPRLVEGERLADAVPHCTGLARQPAARDRAPHVELAEPVGYDKGLADQHPQYRTGEIDRAVTAVDLDLAVAWPDPHAGDRILALAGRVRAAERVALRLHVLGQGSEDRHRCGGRRRPGRLRHRLAQAAQPLEGLP